MSEAVFDVQWSDTARDDLATIVRFIAEDDPAQAAIILKRLRQKSTALSRFPKRGRVVPELHTIGIHIYREVVTSPWRIVYRIDSQMVSILAVLDSRRDLQDLLLQRLIY